MGQESVNGGALRRRGSPRLPFIWLPALAAVLVAIAFPAAAGAAPLAAPAPVNTSPPTIVIPPGGASNEITNPSVGRYLQSTDGTWTGQSYLKRQWVWCNTTPVTPIPGAINSTYQIASGDVGHTLCFTVTGYASGSSTTASSTPTGVVTTGTPINHPPGPRVTGVTQDGQTLTTTSGTWDGTQPITYAYQWQRCDGAGLNCGKPFPSPGSASNTYTLTDADLGHTMVAYVTATNPAGSTATHSPVTTTVVTPGNTAPPSISGTAQEGKTLTESHGSWIPKSPSGYSYQWQDCDGSGNNCSAIAGATSQNYTATAFDVGHTLRVLESATAGGITSAPVASGATGTVKPGTPAPGGNGGNGGTGAGNGGGNAGGNGGSGTTTGPVKINKAQIRRLLLKLLAAKGNAGTIRGVLKHGGYKFTFVAPSPGRLVISWSSGKTLVATVALVFHRSGRATAVVFLTSSGRSLLSGHTRMRLLAKGAFTPAGHGTIRASKRITLRA
ncbi:MAG: hypothetical protein JO130_09150 [Solirubrobacterales bacterium]|nr:hypothetical protein [Solirubrobacterales bacterium]